MAGGRKARAKKQGGTAEITELSREDIRGVFAKDAIMQSEMADARGEFGRMVAQLETQKGFIPKIYRALRSVTRGKNPAAIQAAIKTFNLYADLAGFNDQKDIEEFIKSQPDTRTTMEKHMDGDIEDLKKQGWDGEAAASQPADPEEKKALNKFRKAISEAETPDAVNKGIEKFLTDHPDLEDEAVNLASARIQELGKAAKESREPASVH